MASSRETNSSYYIIKITFQGIVSNGKTYSTDDVLHYHVIRVPMQKLANITKVILPLPLSVYVEIEHLTMTKDFIRVDVEFSLVDPTDHTSTNRKFKSIPIKNNKYVLISIKSEQQVTLQQSVPLANLTLVNELCYNLSNSHLFNQAFTSSDGREYREATRSDTKYNAPDQSNINDDYYNDQVQMYKPTYVSKGARKPLDHVINDHQKFTVLARVVDRYFAHLQSAYGEAAFRLNMSFDYNELLNNHFYDQVLINANSDLQVLKMLWNNYKWIHQPGYIYFDDFNMHPTFKHEEVVIHANTLTPNWLDFNSKIDGDVSNLQDLAIDTRIINKTPYNDVRDTLNYKVSDKSPTTTQFIIESDDNIFLNSDINKVDPKLLYINESTEESDDFVLGKSLNLSSNTTLVEKEFKSSQILTAPQRSISVKAPDNRENALGRLIAGNKISTQYIQSITTFESKSAHLSSIDFGVIYNLNLLLSNSYVYEPISIINKFTKSDYKATTMQHSATYQCIEWIDYEEYLDKGLEDR